jgi:cell division protein FtsB
MFDQITKYQHHLRRLQDMRVLGQVVFVVVVLMVSYSGVKVIHTNYKLQQHIAQLQQENEVQKLKNANQKLKNEYYNTPQYLELAARQNFGLAAPGEKELLVPKAVALAHAPEQAGATESDETGGVKKPFYQRNMQAWLDFFLHRTPSTD